MLAPETRTLSAAAFPRIFGGYFLLSLSPEGIALNPNWPRLSALWYNSRPNTVLGAAPTVFYVGMQIRSLQLTEHSVAQTPGLTALVLESGIGMSWRIWHFTVDWSWFGFNAGGTWINDGGVLLSFESSAALNMPATRWLGFQVRGFCECGFTVYRDGALQGDATCGVGFGLLLGRSPVDADEVRSRPESVREVAMVPLAPTPASSAIGLQPAQDVRTASLPKGPTGDTAIEFSLRPSFDIWVTGRLASQVINDVMGPGGGGALDVGVRFLRRAHLYLEWERIVYAPGQNDPYASLASSLATRDFFGGGFRWSGDGRASPLVDLALGYSLLGESGGDANGGTASITFPSWQARIGSGVSFRVSDRLAIEPMISLDLGEVTTFSSTIQAAGEDVHTGAGTVNGAGLRLGVALGISVTYGVPL